MGIFFKIKYFSREGYFEVEDIEEMDVWCKEDTGMQKKLGRDMSGRTRHTTLERKGKLLSHQQRIQI